MIMKTTDWLAKRDREIKRRIRRFIGGILWYFVYEFVAKDLDEWGRDLVDRSELQDAICELADRNDVNDLEVRISTLERESDGT